MGCRESSFVIVPTNTIDKLKTRIVDRRAVCGGIDVGLGAPDTTLAFGVNKRDNSTVILLSKPRYNETG